ncbi:MAG: glycosyltransferase, partial [Bacteroidetes bacterium]|nr:glycosyltransferase [Bacteroidota bacterium]
MNKLSIIIPVYNEESAINKLIAQLQQLISNQVAFEIIVVDGGSTDATIA